MKQIENLKIDVAAAAASSGTSDVDGSALDMAGYEGVLLFVYIGTANSGNYLQALHGNTNSPSDTVEGSKVVTDSNGDVAVLEINRPKYRYIKPQVKRGSATVTGEVYAIRYGARVKPVTNDVANSQNVVALATPATGTP